MERAMTGVTCFILTVAFLIWPLLGFVSFLSTSLVTTDKFTSLQIIGIRREEKSLAPFYDTAIRKSTIARKSKCLNQKIAKVQTGIWTWPTRTESHCSTTCATTYLTLPSLLMVASPSKFGPEIGGHCFTYVGLEHFFPRITHSLRVHLCS